MDKYKFPCGCSYIIREHPNGYKEPLINFTHDNIQDCHKVWDLYASGKLCGVFQCDSNLGMKWAKELKPTSIEHLAAMVSIVRPGTLNSFDETGKSLTQKYCDRKNGKETTPIQFPALQNALKDTYGVICIHEDTDISLESGYHKPIRHIKKNDIISTLNIQDLSITNNICDGCEFAKISDGYKITLSNGYSVILTDDHEILTWNGYKQVKNLCVKNDIICCPEHINTRPNQVDLMPWLGSNESVAYLFGQIIGDGSSTSRCVIAVGTEENADKLSIWAISHLNNIKTKKYFHCRSWYLHITHSMRTNEPGYSGKKTQFMVDLVRYGLLKSCFEKRIPKEIFESSDNVKWSFLAGYFDADGHGCDGVRNITSANQYLLSGLRQIFTSLGIINYLNKIRIYAQNIKKFDNNIEQYLVLKNSQLIGKKIIGNDVGVIPNQVLIEKFKTLNINKKQLYKKYNIQSSAFKVNFNKYKTAIKLGIHTGDVRFHKIKTIQKIENQHFWSMSVRNTHNLLANGIVVKNCYQEQQIFICQDICGFNPSEADELRRGVGKKKMDVILSLEKKFIDGAKRIGKISETDAKNVFEWIKSASRYSFNKSHGTSYAIRSYGEAYLKTHFPLAFYTSKLKSPRGSKTHEDINDLVYEAKQFGIETKLPDLRDNRPEFYHDGKHIYFGLIDIKSFGQSNYSAVSEMIDKCGPKVWENFFEFAINSSRYLTESVVKLLIKAGAVDFFGMSRSQMLEEYDLVNKLTKKEKTNLFRYYDAEKIGIFDNITKVEND